MNNAKDSLKRICLVSVLISLCTVGTYIHIPLPTGGKVHLGNFICILSALLLGGFPGGVIGGVGMFLADVFMGEPIDTMLRTLIVKFLLGLVVGYLFRFLLSNSKYVKKPVIYSLSFIFFSLLFMVLFNLVKFNDIFGQNLKMYVFSILIALFLVGLMIVFDYVYKTKKVVKVLLITCYIGVIFNITAEFILRFFLKQLFDGLTAKEAFTLCVSRLPSSTTTGVITIVLVVGMFFPTLKATKVFFTQEELNLDFNQLIEEEDNKLH